MAPNIDTIQAFYFRSQTGILNIWSNCNMNVKSCNWVGSDVGCQANGHYSMHSVYKTWAYVESLTFRRDSDG